MDFDNWTPVRQQIMAQLAECISRHCANCERDGMANSAEHVDKINEDARAIHALCNGQDWKLPIHL